MGCAAETTPGGDASRFEGDVSFEDGRLVESSKADELGATIVDQEADDITVSRTFLVGEVRGFAPDECEPIDDATMDCTRAVERRFERPALHPVVVSRRSESFFCRALAVEAVVEDEAMAYARGIGLYYRGVGGPSVRFVSSDRLEATGARTLARGARASTYELVGLVSCWLGSSSSSFAATYEFKPFLGFYDAESDTFYRNWDLAQNYVSRAASPELDRSAEVLRAE